MMLNYRLIKTEKRRRDAQDTRRVLFTRCRAAIEEMGDDIAGFAMVVWDNEGHLRSSYDTRGPIRAPLVPTLVADALNRHLAVMLAEEQARERGS
jgi:hypothetical protein